MMGECLTVAVPFPVVGALGAVAMWGVVCPEHPFWGAVPAATDVERCCAEAFAEACVCTHPVHRGVDDYPVGAGREFNGGEWVDYGVRGYRVVFDGTGQETAAAGGGDWSVLWFAGAYTRVVKGAQGVSRDEAHLIAWRLAAPPH